MLADIGSERALLSGIFLYGLDGYLEISDLVSTNCFTNESNQIIFNCLQAIYRDHLPRKIDLPTFLSTADKLGFKSYFGKTNELRHLKAVSQSHVELSNIREFAKIVKRLSLARQLVIELDEAKSEVSSILGNESLSHILGLAEKRVLGFSNNLTDKPNEPNKLSEGIKEYLQFIEENPGQIGIPTGYLRYDSAIGGGLRVGVSMIGSRRKIGKSSFCLNVALNISQNLNIPVLILDTEMSVEEHFIRVLSNLTEIPKKDIESGRFKEQQHKKNQLYEACNKLENLPLKYISVVNKPFEEILSIIRRWFLRNVGEGNQGVIIYDFFRVSSAKSITASLAEYQILGYQMTGLNELCIQYKLPCLAFTQLNKDMQVAASDRLSWYSINYSLFKDKTPEQIEEDGPKFGNRCLIPKISRHGPEMAFGDYISMSFRGDICKIEETATKSEITQQSEISI